VFITLHRDGCVQLLLEAEFNKPHLLMINFIACRYTFPSNVLRYYVDTRAPEHCICQHGDRIIFKLPLKPPDNVCVCVCQFAVS
jgi:hypothetical protein